MLTIKIFRGQGADDIELYSVERINYTAIEDGRLIGRLSIGQDEVDVTYDDRCYVVNSVGTTVFKVTERGAI